MTCPICKTKLKEIKSLFTVYYYCENCDKDIYARKRDKFLDIEG